MRRAPRRAGLAAALSLLACSGDATSALTQITVIVRSDIAALTSIEIEVSGIGKASTARADLGKKKLPRTLAVVHRGGPLGPVTITARGLLGSDPIVERAAKLSFVSGRNVALILELVAACREVACPRKGDTCIAGTCESSSVDASKLGTFDGDAGKDLPDVALQGDAGTDAGVSEGGLDGAGGSGDAAPPDAASDATLDTGTPDAGPQCPSGFIDTDGVVENGCEARAFGYAPSHVDPADPALDLARAATLVVDCSVALDFGSGAVPADVAVCSQVIHPVVIAPPSGPELVVVPLLGLEVLAGQTLTLRGARPVVFLVYGGATIAGHIDAGASGTTPGPGGNVSCAAGTGGNGTQVDGAIVTDIGGGGGGGGFGSDGGGGGNASPGGAGAAGVAEAGTALTAALRGGCAGGAGGNGASAGGSGGAGGGAVQLSVAGALAITGYVSARGAGGGVAAAASKGGGGGGGSGGAILVEAASLTIGAAAFVSANGGGGGEGASSSNAGVPVAGGAGSATDATAAAGGSGGSSNGGDGGVGGAGATAAAAGDDGSNSGFPIPSTFGAGGGGGGGVGRVHLRASASCDLQGGTSPAATTECP